MTGILLKVTLNPIQTNKQSNHKYDKVIINPCPLTKYDDRSLAYLSTRDTVRISYNVGALTVKIVKGRSVLT